MQESNYLGTEKVGSLLRKFAVPCIFSLIISCLYNIVDQIFVGNGIGYLGNAATDTLRGRRHPASPIIQILFCGYSLTKYAILAFSSG